VSGSGCQAAGVRLRVSGLWECGRLHPGVGLWVCASLGVYRRTLNTGCRMYSRAHLEQ
jgi:hypothetical protein